MQPNYSKLPRKFRRMMVVSPDPETFVTHAQSLEESVDTLVAEMKVANKRGKMNRRLIYGVASALVLNVLALVSLAVLFYGVKSNSEHISIIQDRTSNKVLCPVYQAFLQNYSHKSAAYERDPAGYEKVYAVIRMGYTELDCQ
jgi:hypothetical protein